MVRPHYSCFSFALLKDVYAGVIKTHRLLLLQLDELLAPTVPDDPSQAQSTVTAGPRVLRDLLDNMKSGSNKAERQLAWEFGAASMSLKTIEGERAYISVNAFLMMLQGVGDVSTEVSMSAHDVTSYDVPAPPITLSFHIREFAVSSSLLSQSSSP